jgi:hypothetical protein
MENKFRKGDVVVLHSSPNPSEFVPYVDNLNIDVEGFIGVVHSVYVAPVPFAYVHIGRMILFTIPLKDLEVIDHDESLLEEPKLKPEIRRGDVVVFKEFYPNIKGFPQFKEIDEGTLGIVLETNDPDPSNKDRVYVRIEEDKYDDKGLVGNSDGHTRTDVVPINILEVIDHDESLLEESKPQFIVELPPINPIDINDFHHKIVDEAAEKAMTEVQNNEEPICGPDAMHWPYNAGKKSMLQPEIHTGPVWMNEQIVNIVIDAKTATLIIKCHDCGTILKTLKLEWDHIIGR